MRLSSFPGELGCLLTTDARPRGRRQLVTPTSETRTIPSSELSRAGACAIDSFAWPTCWFLVARFVTVLPIYVYCTLLHTYMNMLSMFIQ